MLSERTPMTADEFRRLPRKLGWKYEYQDGEVHTTPVEIVVCYELVLKPREEPALKWAVRPPLRDDSPKLVEAFAASYGNTVECAGYTEEQVQASAQKTVRNHFAGTRGSPSPVSRIALLKTAVEAAAMVVQDRRGPLLDILMVRPKQQRKGVATALVSQVVNALLASGEVHLRSRAHLANEASVAWHRKFGFSEEPDLHLARLRMRHSIAELERLKEISQATPTHEKETQRLRHVVKQLELRAQREGIETVSPLMAD